MRILFFVIIYCRGNDREGTAYFDWDRALFFTTAAVSKKQAIYYFKQANPEEYGEYDFQNYPKGVYRFPTKQLADEWIKRKCELIEGGLEEFDPVILNREWQKENMYD